MSTKSVKTRAYDDLRLIRRARPYRMAVIELNFAAGNVLSYRYIFNEFGNIASNFTRLAQGNYELTIKPDSFKNKENAAVEFYLTVNSLSPFVFIFPSITANISLNTISFLTVEALTFNFTDFQGKGIIIIKEYY